MSYYQNREALVMIANELEEKGWTIFGYKADESDLMTDYWSPASWDGIATKNGYVLVIDNHNNHYSGYEVKKYNYNKTTYKASARIEKLEAMMNDPASTENEKASCAVLIEKEKEKQGIAPTYTVIETYPIFHHGNPKHSNWHIEKDGQIVAKGSGAFAVNSYDWENKEKTAAEQKAEKLAKFIVKIEKVLTASDALKSEVVKVAKVVTKPVEKGTKEINEGDILSFSYHGHYWIVNKVYTVGEQVRVTYELLGSEKRGYQRTSNAKRYYQPLARLQKEMQEGKVKVYTMQEVTEYVEKTVFKKTKRTQKASDAVQIESNEVVTEEPTNQQETAQEPTESVKTDEGKATLTINKEKNGIEITFDSKPSDNIIEALKENGFKWSKFGGKWWTKQTTDRLKFATMLVESYNSIMEEKPVKEEVEAAQEVTEATEQTETATQYTDVLSPFEYGVVAFHKGMKRVPAFDQEFLDAYFIGLQVGEGAEFSKEWLKGWDYANLEVSVNSEPANEQEQTNKVVYHDFTYNSTDNEKLEESEPMNVNAFDDIMSKFDNIEVTANDKVSADDLEFCKEQQNIYDMTIGAYNSLNDALQAAKAIAHEHGIKYGLLKSGYSHTQDSAISSGFSVYDLRDNSEKIKNRFITCICTWFEEKYNITIDEYKMHDKYDTKVTYENIIDDIMIQLGGYNFTEKAAKEIKDKAKEAVRNADKLTIKNAKLTIDGYFVRHDSIWKEYRLNGQYQEVLKALQHFEDGSTSGNAELINRYVGYDNERKASNYERYEVQTLNKVKSIKFLKNGKMEIEFISSILAYKFASEYCGYAQQSA